MPSFAEYAIKELKKHPEIASALLEFEKTKKIPRFTYRKRLDVTINESALREFKMYCRMHHLNMSRVMESAMVEIIKKRTPKSL